MKTLEPKSHSRLVIAIVITIIFILSFVMVLFKTTYAKDSENNFACSTFNGIFWGPDSAQTKVTLIKDSDIDIEKYDGVTDFYDNRAIVFVNGKQGIIDTNGRYLIEPGVYHYMDFVDDGIAAENDEKIMSLSYMARDVLLKDYIVVRSGDLCGLIDNTGKTILRSSLDFDDVYLINSQYAVISKRALEVDQYDKLGVVRLSDEKKIVPLEYSCLMMNADCSRIFAQKRLVYLPTSEEAKMNGYLDDADIYDFDGNIVGNYDAVCYPQEGLATVVDDGKCGVIDADGNLVIPFRYTRIDCFSDGLAYYEDGDKSGYIDRRGNIQ